MSAGGGWLFRTASTIPGLRLTSLYVLKWSPNIVYNGFKPNDAFSHMSLPRDSQPPLSYLFAAKRHPASAEPQGVGCQHGKVQEIRSSKEMEGKLEVYWDEDHFLYPAHCQSELRLATHFMTVTLWPPQKERGRRSCAKLGVITIVAGSLWASKLPACAARWLFPPCLFAFVTPDPALLLATATSRDCLSAASRQLWQLRHVFDFSL